MAVVTLYAKSHKDPSLIGNPEAAFAEGRMRCISTGAVAITNGNSINSLIYLGKIPSNAVPVPGLSLLKHGAVTSVNDFDIGLYRDDVLVDIDIFADGLDISSAGAKDPFAAIAVADWGKRVWELLGLATDPGCEYQIVATLKAAATATASIAGQLFYAKK